MQNTNNQTDHKHQDWQPEHWQWLAFTELNLRFSQSRQLIQRWPDIGELFYEVDLSSLSHVLSDQQLTVWHELRRVDLVRYLQKQYRWLQQHPAQLITWHDARFPASLKQIEDCPGWLWVQGKAQLLHDPAVSMVGGRRASPSGLALAREYGQSLASAGLTIISGLALGIDGASHQGALDAGGDTIAVLGSGLADIYPARHQYLAAEIVNKGGALVSPWPLFLAARPHQFPVRNSIVSGLSLGVLVVEAAPKSGSLITAKLALEQGREVFALPSSAHNRQAQGSLGLIRDGACLVYSPQQIIAELAPMLTGLTGVLTPDMRTSPEDAEAILQHLSPQLQQLLNQLGYDPLPVDIICQQLALPYAEVATLLMELTLLGYVAEAEQGFERIR